MTIDFKKCKSVTKILNDYFLCNENLSTIEYPKSIEYKSNEYFIYIFYSCLLDYGMNSKLYHKNLSNTYDKYSYIFIPNKVSDISPDELKNIIIQNIHPRYPNIALKKWIKLSNELEKYNNIVDTLSKINNFQELTNFINSLDSYGQKTGGLLIRIIVDSNICNFNEKVEFIPIDRHDMEISYLTGIIDSEKLNHKEIKLLSNAYVKVGNELKINPSDIDKYLWEIGVSFCNKKKCADCPLNNYCSKR